jgi:protein O-mannosyl-transferase
MNRLSILAFSALIALLALLNFYPVLQNGYSLDDSFYLDQVADIYQAADISKVTASIFSEVDYRPVASISFALEKVLCGTMNPAISHGINLLLYILAVLLFSALVYRLPFLTSPALTAAVAGILFCCLPLHCSMVANVKNRDGLLSFIFGMLFLHVLFSLFKGTLKGYKNLLLLPPAILSIWLSAYSKLDGLTFLMLVPLFAFLFQKSIAWKPLLRAVLLTLLSYRIFMFIFSTWMEQKQTLMPEESIGDPLMFSENPIIAYNDLPTRLAFGVQTVFEYILMLFKPAGHYFYYGYDMIPVLPLSSPVIWLKIIFIAGLVLMAIGIYRKQPAFSFGVFMFFIGLIYCSNLITPVAGIVADRYAFIASAGACIAMAMVIIYGGQLIYQKMSVYYSQKAEPKRAGSAKKGAASAMPKARFPFLKKPGIPGIALVLGISLIYLPFNISRSKDWKSILTLAEADLPKIGERSYEANRIAVKNYVEQAFEIPDENVRINYFIQAINHGMRAVAIYDNSMLVQEGVAMAFYGMNDLNNASEWASKIIQKFDTSEVAWRIMAEYYYKNQRLDSTAYGFKRVLELEPGNAEAYIYYATTLQEIGRFAEAINFTDSIPADRGLPPWLQHQTRAYLYLNARDSLMAVTEIELAFQKGWRDIQMLDVMGVYWWTRDQKKWEDLKKYLN